MASAKVIQVAVVDSIVSRRVSDICTCSTCDYGGQICQDG